jgi:putative transcriptional regulator
VAAVAARVHAEAAGGALAEPNAAAIRQRAGLSQTEFAAALDVPVSTLRNWEQGRRAPRGPARQLLRVAAVAPEVLALLRAAS